MRFARNVAVYATADLLANSITLLMSPLMTRLLSPAQYGSFGLLMALWGMVMWIQYAGMDNAFPFFRANTPTEEQPGVIATSTMIASVASLLFTLALVAIGALTPWLGRYADIGKVEVTWFLVGRVAVGLTGWYLYVLRFLHHAFAFARISLLGRVFGTVVAVAVLPRIEAAHRLQWFMLINASAQWLGLVWALVELKRLDVPAFDRVVFSKPLARRMLSYGTVVIPGAVAYSVTFSLDRFMVGWLAGAEEASLLSLAVFLAAAVMMLRSWFLLVWNPHLVEWLAAKDPATYGPRLQAAAIALAVVFFSGAAVTSIWADVIVAWIYPSFYAPVGALVGPVVLGGAFAMLSLIANTTSLIADNPRLYFPVSMAGLIVNVVVCLAAIPMLGARGAVLGTLASEITIFIGWLVIGRLWLRNLVLRWRAPIVFGAVAIAFVFGYRNGILPGVHPLLERSLATLAWAGAGVTVLWRHAPAAGWKRVWS